MGERDININDVLRSQGVEAARAMHDEARSFEPEGAVILNDVRSFLSRFIAYPSEHAKIAHVLWVVHPHLMGAWEARHGSLSCRPSLDQEKRALWR
jgi:hypothetical protein